MEAGAPQKSSSVLSLQWTLESHTAELGRQISLKQFEIPITLTGINING